MMLMLMMVDDVDDVDDVVDNVDNDHDDHDDDSTSSESSYNNQLRRRRPKKHSRVNHNTQLLHTEFEDIGNKSDKMCTECTSKNCCENNDMENKLQSFESQYEKLKNFLYEY